MATITICEPCRILHLQLRTTHNQQKDAGFIEQETRNEHNSFHKPEESLVCLQPNCYQLFTDEEEFTVHYMECIARENNMNSVNDIEQFFPSPFRSGIV